MKKLTAVALAALMALVVLAADTASAKDTVEINAIGTNYEYDGWSNEQYPLIDLFGEEYVSLFFKNGNIWNCRVDKLAKLVLDSDTNYTLKTGEKLDSVKAILSKPSSSILKVNRSGSSFQKMVSTLMIKSLMSMELPLKRHGLLPLIISRMKTTLLS